MKTFLNIFFVWPIKIAILFMAVGLIFVLGIVLISKASSMGKDIRDIKTRLF